MAAKLLQNIKGAKLLKELKEFDNLIKAIGECKSKAEEGEQTGSGWLAGR